MQRFHPCSPEGLILKTDFCENRAAGVTQAVGTRAGGLLPACRQEACNRTNLPRHLCADFGHSRILLWSPRGNPLGTVPRCLFVSEEWHPNAKLRPVIALSVNRFERTQIVG